MRRGLSKIWLVALPALLAMVSSSRAQPAVTLPRYNLDIVLDVAAHHVQVRDIVTWTNTSKAPVKQIVFNARACYQTPDKDIGFLAKMAELLRMSPRESMNLDGPVMLVDAV